MTDAVKFDLDQVTPRMLIEFKEHTGESLLSMVDGLDDEIDLTDVSEEVIAGFIWLGMRMSGNPDATFNDALDTPFTALDFTDDGDVPEDPTNASNAS